MIEFVHEGRRYRTDSSLTVIEIYAYATRQWAPLLHRTTSILRAARRVVASAGDER